MSEMIQDKKENAATALFSIYEQISSLLNEDRSTQHRFVHRDCSPRFLPVFDAPDLKTFQKHAVKVWRKYHPAKRGRPSEEQFIFETCIQLHVKGEISEKLSLGRLCMAVAKSLEAKRERDNAVTVPHEDTIYKFVKEWKKRTKDMTAKGFNLEEIHKTLLDTQKGRPYNPLAPWRSPRKK